MTPDHCTESCLALLYIPMSVASNQDMGRCLALVADVEALSFLSLYNLFTLQKVKLPCVN